MTLISKEIELLEKQFQQIKAHVAKEGNNAALHGRTLELLKIANEKLNQAKMILIQARDNQAGFQTIARTA